MGETPDSLTFQCLHRFIPSQLSINSHYEVSRHPRITSCQLRHWCCCSKQSQKLMPRCLSNVPSEATVSKTYVQSYNACSRNTHGIVQANVFDQRVHLTKALARKSLGARRLRRSGSSALAIAHMTPTM